ncbi:hypothetical protein DXG01_000257 [Tephrocybe rancida]|nr:hypothetical protein DXG01_000257 [Tephrocybe rancida]
MSDLPAPAYTPKPTLKYASAIGLQAGAVGVFVSAVQNALGSHSNGAMGFLTRTGGTIALFAGMGATFALTESVVANQRQKDDAVNGAAGACAAGFLAGIRVRSIPMAVGGCVILGATMGAFDYSGQLSGQAGLTQEEKRRRFFKQVPKHLEGAE